LWWTNDTPEDVASTTITGLLQKDINVIMGGQERRDQIETISWSRKIDQVAAANLEALTERTKNHRSMESI
jgi:hypothetical protein